MYPRARKVRDESEDFGLSNWKDRVVIYRLGKTEGGTDLGRKKLDSGQTEF